MDIEAYIQSGVIESYVLGLATSEEIAELETLSKNYPAIQEAINSFSLALEEQAVSNAIQPPAYLKSKVMEAILENPSKPVAKIQPIHATPVRQLSSYKMLAAASVILFIVSAAANFYLYNKYNEKDKAYQALASERNSLYASNQIYQTNLKQWDSAALLLANPAMAIIKMNGVTGKENNVATLFWDTRSKDVYVMPIVLPHPSDDKQYQLWALVNGKPVDAGLLNNDGVGVSKMKNIPAAQGFAITLENKGGSPVPTMANMYVLGNS